MRSYLYPLALAVVFDLAAVILVYVVFIYTNYNRNGKVVANADNPLKAMYSG